MSNFKSTWSSNKLVKDSSSFWMSDSWFDDTDPLTGEVIEKDNTADLIKLSAYRRAVSNFVNIVTGDNVPVKFSNTDSYTDGKTVWIAAKLDDKNFDANVGLALHEGSHIKYSDFDVLKGLSDRVDKRYGKAYGGVERHQRIVAALIKKMLEELSDLPKVTLIPTHLMLDRIEGYDLIDPGHLNSKGSMEQAWMIIASLLNNLN